MTTLTEKTIAWMLRHPLVCALVAIFVIVAGAWGTTGIKTDNTLESWFDSEDSRLDDYNEFVNQFGSEQFVLVIIRRDDIYATDAVAADRALAAKFIAIDGVRDVLCMSRILDKLEIAPADAKKYFANLELFKRVLVAENGKSCALFLMLDTDIANRREALMADTYRVLRENFDNDADWAVTGATPVNVEVNDASKRQLAIIMPAMILVSALILLVIFRCLSGVVLPVLGAAVSVAATVFLFRVCGKSMSLVTMMIPPLVFFLSLSAAIHILAAIRRNLGDGGNLREAITRACATVGSPCFFACFTTSAGFASLAVSRVSPIRDLALFGAAGIMLSFFAIFLVVPLGYMFMGRVGWLALTPAPQRKASRRAPAAMRKSVCVASIVLSVLIAASSLISLQWIESDANTLSFFPKDTPVVVAAKIAAEDFSGGTTCEIVLELNQPFYEAASLEAVRNMQAFLDTQPEVKKTVSFIDFGKAAYYSYKRNYRPETYVIPEKVEESLFFAKVTITREEFLQKLGDNKIPGWGNYVSPDGNTVRIQTFAHTFSSAKYKAMLDNFRARFDELGPAVKSAQLTGGVPLLVEAQKNVTETQLNSFFIAFGVIAVVMLLTFRSLKIALISLVPNLLPVVVALGMIKVIGATLNVATVLVAGIALGIAVDDTIHFLSHYRRARAAGKDAAESITAAFAVVRRPMITTTLVACAGFAVFCISEFAPVFYFGVLTSSAMAVALLGDIYLLPALFMIFDRKK